MRAPHVTAAGPRCCSSARCLALPATRTAAAAAAAAAAAGPSCKPQGASSCGVARTTYATRMTTTPRWMASETTKPTAWDGAVVCCVWAGAHVRAGVVLHIHTHTLQTHTHTANTRTLHTHTQDTHTHTRHTHTHKRIHTHTTHNTPRATRTHTQIRTASSLPGQAFLLGQYRAAGTYAVRMTGYPAQSGDPGCQSGAYANACRQYSTADTLQVRSGRCGARGRPVAACRPAVRARGLGAGAHHLHGVCVCVCVCWRSERCLVATRCCCPARHGQVWGGDMYTSGTLDLCSGHSGSGVYAADGSRFVTAVVSGGCWCRCVCASVRACGCVRGQGLRFASWCAFQLGRVA
jgi:hypothetical protein